MRQTDIVHGTHDGYNNHGCRCLRCREAGTMYRLSRLVDCANRCGRKIKPRKEHSGLCASCSYAARRGPDKHGTETQYTNRGCRCDACRKAATAARNRRRLGAAA